MQIAQIENLLILIVDDLLQELGVSFLSFHFIPPIS